MNFFLCRLTGGRGVHTRHTARTECRPGHVCVCVWEGGAGTHRCTAFFSDCGFRSAKCLLSPDGCMGSNLGKLVRDFDPVSPSPRRGDDRDRSLCTDRDSPSLKRPLLLSLSGDRSLRRQHTQDGGGHTGSCAPGVGGGRTLGGVPTCFGAVTTTGAKVVGQGLRRRVATMSVRGPCVGSQRAAPHAPSPQPLRARGGAQ